jgi:hypothetical protein
MGGSSFSFWDERSELSRKHYILDLGSKDRVRGKRGERVTEFIYLALIIYNSE